MSTETEARQLPALPKWPALIVKGEPVTVEQAAEVIIRTTEVGWLSCNDSRLTTAVRAAFGIREGQHGFPVGEDVRAARERLAILDLEHLDNEQILSSWIGGPHGWMSWSGHVGCSNFNIGKWPSVEQVEEEWQAIAEAFPFLRLHAQLLSGETCEDDIRPLVEFVVKDGKVVTIPYPERMLGQPETDDAAMMAILMQPAAIRESGCSIEALKAAIALTERALEERA